MTVLSWYILSSLLGWFAFPLAFRLFPALADRGYTLSRAAGILVWGWAFWLLNTLGILRNDLGSLLFAFVIVIGLSALTLLRTQVDRYTRTQVHTYTGTQDDTSHLTPDTSSPPTDHWSLKTDHLRSWLSSNRRLILLTEILFLAAFLFMAYVRAANPDATGTEKPMELAFINATLRSPSLPPNDPWMSGYSISYYHFGYILTSMFAMLTGTAGSVAFNLMSALVFALAAVGSYGILYNLLCAYKGKYVDTYTGTHVDTSETPILDNQEPTANSQEPIPTQHATRNTPSPVTDHWSLNTGHLFLALLAPLFLLFLSNLEGLLEVIHGLGWFWTTNSQQPTANFWTWLNIKDLIDPPSGSAIPQRFWWWWRASRVVQDTDLLGAPQEVIDEFPFFSFLLGDLHPHVLALPFNILGLGVALNLFLDGWRGFVNFLDYRLKATPRDFLFAALVLGGLAFLNTWDILPAGLIIVGAYILSRVRSDGWSWQRLEDALLLGIPLAVAAFLLYLPFYIGFSSQAGGLLPNIVNPTRGAHTWVMWGTLILPLLAWLLYLTRASATRPRYLPALAWTLGGLLLLWLFSILLALVAQRVEPAFAAQYLASQGQPDLASLFQAATARRLDYIGGMITIGLIAWLSLAHLLGTQVDTYTGTHAPADTDNASSPDASTPVPSTLATRPTDHWSLNTDHFVLLLTLLASLLILIPDFIYLRDYFGYRINTVFKFYYQAWTLWSLAAAFGTAILLKNVKRSRWNIVSLLLITVTTLAGLIYPILALPDRTDNFKLGIDLILAHETPMDASVALQLIESQLSSLTLDSAAYLERFSPEDAAAVRYLQSAPMGVVAEAVGGSYSGYARISTHSGLPTVLGWPWHEFQWRGSWEAHGTREADIKFLYEVPNWENARLIIERYRIKYIVVGGLERATYNVSEAKFQRNLPILYQAGTTVIYGAP
jgi:YYY domain-containing protein